ncbi:hypothetical protein O1L60_10375 [Streptomyces diastatochromogenes]|nr:hypothetical protein [Streptomyces diastatochromogenes]
MSGTENVRRRRNALAASVAAGVLIAGGGGVYLAVAATSPGAATRPRRPTGPPGRCRPRLRAWRRAAAAPGSRPVNRTRAAARAGRSTKPGPPPQGPSSAAVHRPEGLVTSAEVTRLAEALGIGDGPRWSGTSGRSGPRRTAGAAPRRGPEGARELDVLLVRRRPGR